MDESYSDCELNESHAHPTPPYKYTSTYPFFNETEE